jgi:hypothetical protein
MKLLSGLLAGVLFSTALPLSAQSLGDLAKKEQERRKSAPPAKKTYTNDDLKQVPPPAGTPAADSAVKPSSDKDAAAKAEPEKVDATKPAEPAKDEAFWRGRITQAREELRRNEMFSETLQVTINSQTADFVNRDDPAQRAVIADNRQKSLAELDRVKSEIEKNKKAIADIEEEARRAGVPPGWLR